MRGVPGPLDPAQRRAAEAAERFETAHPADAMRRREFLGRTAALAGGAALASVLPPDRLVAAAARAQARVVLPSPRNMPIDTFVVLMMENRSFDHYFGWHPRADARNAGLVYPDAEGNPVPTHRLAPDFQGCEYRDPDHSWEGGRHQYGGGKMNGFVQGNASGTGSDEFAAGYYLKQDNAFLPHAADRFQLYDRFFCSIMASTFPNRHYMWAAQCGDTRGNEFPSYPDGFQWETIFDRAHARGVDATYFFVDLPASGLYGERAIPWTSYLTEYYERAAAGTLSAINFVDPPFGDVGLFGNGASDHPHSDTRLGQAFISDVVNAFVDSPQFARGALFIVYDEWGGFFDHVRPRFVPDDRARRDINETYGLTGFRIPAITVSPWVRRGAVSHATCTFESILKMISYRFRLGHLNKRHRYAFNIARTFNWARPNLSEPGLPDPNMVASTPCVPTGRIPGGEARSGTPPHDLTKLASSGYLDRIGMRHRPATLARAFRNPDSLGKALESTGTNVQGG